MASTSTLQDLCPTCRHPLRPDHSCLHCAMDQALKAAAEDPGAGADLPEAETGFAALSDPPLPMEIGRFRLVARLGMGGMGAVYEAEDRSLGRTVALKILRGYRFSTAGEKVRFQQEAQVVARLDHPDIVPVYELGELDGCPFLASKLIRGGTLSDRLQAGRMKAEEAAAIMARVAAAVAHAHEKGVLHRDLKPSNILIDGTGKPWLTDFGMARMEGTEAALTATGAQIGTPCYMSPEQAAGKVRGITAASDIWALGAILYEMLTGCRPYEGESNIAIMHQVVSGPAPVFRATSVRERDLSVLIGCCLQKEPEQRLPSARILAEELGRWLRGEPILSRPIPPAAGSWRWVRRHRGAAAMAGFSVAAAVWWLNTAPPPAAAGPQAGMMISRQGSELLVRDVAGENDVLILHEVAPGQLEVRTNDQPVQMPDGTVTLRMSRPIPLAGISRIIVDAGGGHDAVTVQTFEGDRFPALSISGGPGNDLVLFDGPITFAPGASLEVDLQNDAPEPGADTVQFNFGSRVRMSGTGSITVKCSGRIWVGAKVELRTVDGGITLEANQQAVPLAGNFKGVEMVRGFVGSDGKGTVTVRGRGGSRGIFQFGISLSDGAVIQGGTAGVTTLTGTGGPGNDNDNSGINMLDGTSRITTIGADLVVNGTGSGVAGTASNNGVAIVGGWIEGGGKQTTVTGRGGPVGKSGNGVLIRGADAGITSTGGAVRVTGYGGAGDGPACAGVVILDSGVIKADGSGPVSAAGYGGPGSGILHHGVALVGGSITSGGGDIQVTARRGNEESADLQVRLPGRISGGKVTLLAESQDYEKEPAGSK